tara:strand:- start:472 stop:6069 length:5598 start_codon:yes stop_codon:yes gene_type:complete
MPEIKNSFVQGRMNLDLDERLIPNGEYREALNVQVSTSEDSDVGSVQNVLGNNLLVSYGEESGILNTSELLCIGSISDEKNNRFYWFVVEKDNIKSAIIEYNVDLQQATPIIVDEDNTVLEFSEENYITGINIVDDFLFFTDGVTEPKKINIEQFRINQHTNLGVNSDFFVLGENKGAVKKEHITVIKQKPTKPPVLEFITTSIDYGKFPGANQIQIKPVTLAGLQAGDIYTAGSALPVIEFSLPMEQVQAANTAITGTLTDATGLNSYTGINPFAIFDILAGVFFNVDDILLLSDPGLVGTLPNNAQIKIKVNAINYIGGGYVSGSSQTEPINAQIDYEVLSVNEPIPLVDISYNFVIENLTRVLFERGFPRFSYRYKYQDGEYSAFGPFTEVGFKTGMFNIHPTREPYNSAMENNITRLDLKDFVTYDIPEGVVEIDLLYKPENSTTVFSLDTIKPKNVDGTDNVMWTTTDGSTSTVNLYSSSSQASDTGFFPISTDIIYAAIPENQLLRPYDNVPKRAKAQDFTANRLIYGNYTQNLKLTDFENKITVSHIDRSDHYDLKSQDGSKPSVKSLRTYQVGISFLDLYGRETPVFSAGNTSSVTIPFDDDATLNFIGNASRSLQLEINNIPELGVNTDAAFFKIFVKETASEYYNLVLDRVYRAEEDGNLWLSFPSSDRNKLQEDDFLILKKTINTGTQVEDDNKFKVIDISNEAPEFIRSKYKALGSFDGDGDLFGNTSSLYPESDFQPRPDSNKLIIRKDSILDEGGEDIQPLFDRGINISIKFQKEFNANIINSKRYEIISLETEDAGSDEHYRITLDQPIQNEDQWVEDSVGTLTPTLKTTIRLEVNRNWEEFQGRFFVKIISNIITAQYIETQISDSFEQIFTSVTQIFALIDSNLFQGAQDPNYLQTTTTNLSTSNPTTQADWQTALEFGTGDPKTNAWFIDEMYFASHQHDADVDYTVGNYGTPTPHSTSQGTAALGYEFDVSGSGSLMKATHPGNASASFSTFPLVAVANSPLKPADGGIINGLEGIFQANSQYYNYNTGALRAWKKQQQGTFTLFGQEVYGPQNSNGYYMHLSYSKLGLDLHDGVNLNAGSPINDWYQPSTIGPVQTVEDYHPSHAKINLQAIQNNNSQASVAFDTLKVCNVPQDNSGTDLNLRIKHQWDPIGVSALNNYSASNEQLILQLKAGSKFTFTNDTSGEVFTILEDPVVKRIYNHTAWNRKVKWDGTQFVEDQTTVHYAWHKFVKESASNASAPISTALNTAFEDLKKAIKRFGAADNRRVCYIIRLDKDPSTLITNPEALAAGANDFIQFFQPYISENDSEISDDPAIFETEPKEQLDLDIYYEASQAYPLKIDNSTKGHITASAGDIAKCSINAANIIPQPTNNIILDNKVKGWIGNIVHLDIGLLTTQGTGGQLASVNYQNNVFAGATLTFYKKDDSFITYEIEEILNDNDGSGGTLSTTYNIQGTNYNFITKVKLKPEPVKVGLSYFNCFSFGNGVESNRIRDDFNQQFIKNGVKASTTLQEQYLEDNRTSGLIFSGLYNKNTSLNDLNQFIQAEKITKELEPTYGSIQKLFARDSDLIALCEDKIVQIFADKDAVFNADGNPQLVASNRVLGQSRPFVGEYGISKNPESFASSSYRAYFTDKQRGAVLRLSMDGLTPISDAGMKDWFRDKFKDEYFNIIGSYDTNKDSYNLTFDAFFDFDHDADFKSTESSVTVSYKEKVRGWTSFKGFIQEAGISCVNTYFTTRLGFLYTHDTTEYNNFYGQPQKSYITTIFNDAPTTVKHFNTLNYDGQRGWICDFVNTDLNDDGITLNGFVEKENKYFASIVNNGEIQNIEDTSSFSFQGIGFADSIQTNI